MEWYIRLPLAKYIGLSFEWFTGGLLVTATGFSLYFLLRMESKMSLLRTIGTFILLCLTDPLSSLERDTDLFFFPNLLSKLHNLGGAGGGGGGGGGGILNSNSLFSFCISLVALSYLIEISSYSKSTFSFFVLRSKIEFSSKIKL